MGEKWPGYACSVFAGFTLSTIDVEGLPLRLRHGGAGSRVVLLHGHPRTHTTWHAVAPLLARRHTVICPDLPGYGGSAAGPDQPGHEQSSKRVMAAAVIAAARQLGHTTFALVGHDRGAAVAYRAALDHPDAVSRLVVMDGLPLLEHLERTDERLARAWWHWWFLGQTDKPAERVINADPEAWYRTPEPDQMGAGNHADLWRALRNPAVVHGMCEDYRAGLGIDRTHDEADRAAGRRITAPFLLLQSARDDLDIHGDPARIWERWVTEPVRRQVIDSGHHQAEEAPEQVAAALLDFLACP
jgi:haloacetate dehalogenase